MAFLFSMRDGVIDVADEPVIVLGSWRLVETEAPEGGRLRRLVGRTRSGPERTRISSPVVEWDRGGLRAVTESGRAYRLEQGESVGSDDAAIVAAFVATLEAQGFRDVTDAVMARGGAWPTHDA